MRDLTPKQQRFVEEYLVDLNATAAYRRAGYEAKGNAAEVNAARLLRNAQVAAAIEAAKTKRSARVEVKADDVVRELARVAFGDLRKVAKWGGDSVSFTDSDELDDDAAALVASVKSKVIGNTGTKDEPGENVLALELKTHDKVRALELLARHLGLLNDKLRVVDDRPPTVTLGGEVPPEVVAWLRQERERLAGGGDAR